jgi:hypothetical protein
MFNRWSGKLKPEDLICTKFAAKLFALSIERKFKCIWLHVPNEFAGDKRPVWGMVQRTIGKMIGAPDYVFLWPKGCGCIEFKTPKGRLSDKQKAFKEWCEDVGVPYVVVTSEEEGWLILKEWGLL